MSFDQSFRLEPVQVGGFNQAFRSLTPESVGGPNAAARFETWGASFEQRAGRDTYLGVGGEILESAAERALGVYDRRVFTITPGQTREHQDFVERSAWVSLYQLAGREWSFGARYEFTQAELEDRFTDIPTTATLEDGFQRRQELEAWLHQVEVFAIYNHPSGFFGEVQGLWHGQQNRKDASALAGDSFWHANVYAGCRFFRRRGEVRVGLLNVADVDYRLNPLNLTPDLPRERTFVTSLRWNF